MIPRATNFRVSAETVDLPEGSVFRSEPRIIVEASGAYTPARAVELALKILAAAHGQIRVEDR